MTDPKQPQDSDPLRWAQLRKAGADALKAEAEAEEAKHRADMEPRRQAMRLKERNTRLVMAVVVTVFAMGLLTAGVVVNRWFLSVGAVAGVFACLVQPWRIPDASQRPPQETEETGG